MSRSGYSDNLDQWTLIRWRGQVASAIRGKRGQAFLRDLLAALDAMPNKRLVDGVLVRPDGEVCALGCIGQARGIEMPAAPTDEWDYEGEDNHEALASAFGVAHQLVQEIEFENDEGAYHESPEHRWQRMRDWVAKQIVGVA